MARFSKAIAPLAIFILNCFTVSCHTRNDELPWNYCHAYINTGDCGTDQAAFRGYLRTELNKPGYDRITVFCCPCMKHQYHLIAQGQLALLDRILKVISSRHTPSSKPIKYFSGLATLGHSWRSHLSKIRKTAVNIGMLNKLILFRIPPLAIAGRWGSIDSHMTNTLMQF